MDKLTGEDVRRAVIAAGIEHIEYRACSICGAPIFYLVRDGALFFSSACECSVYSMIAPPEPKEWQEAADWINMQDTPEKRAALAARFGIKP